MTPEHAEQLGPEQRATSSLSVRLLLITVGSLLVMDVAVLVQAITRHRVDYLYDKLATAHLVLTALDVAAEKTEEIDPLLRDNLLSQGRMLGMTVKRPDLPVRTLGPAIPSRIPYIYDLRSETYWQLVADAFATMARRDSYAIGVTGLSPANPAVVVEVVFDERPLRADLWVFAKRVIFLSIAISVALGALVYASLQWLAVRPLRRLTASMTGFQKAPEAPDSIIQPSSRSDEVGVAERTLAAMQQELRAALLQKERLAGVGTAVTKISHDLKNILATAMLESDRLEASSDPEVKRLTAGMVRAVDRAVHLSASTLRFAKEGLPQVKKQTLGVAALLADLQIAIQPSVPSCVIRIGTDVDFSFSGDSELLHRAFENLLRNAAEAGATEVELRATREDGTHTILVSDNGPGLLQKARDSLFVPFAGSTRIGGFGLGLPIARELLRVQGGDITLHTTSAQGTCFVVRLPL